MKSTARYNAAIAASSTTARCHPPVTTARVSAIRIADPTGQTNASRNRPKPRGRNCVDGLIETRCLRGGDGGGGLVHWLADRHTHPTSPAAGGWVG
jgi:hypothetical protein